MYKLPTHRYHSLTVCEDDLHAILYIPTYDCFATRDNLLNKAWLEISDNIEDINYSPTWDREAEDGRKYVLVPYWFIHKFNRYLNVTWDDTYSTSMVVRYLEGNNISLLDLLNTTKTRMAKTMEDIDAYCRPLCD